MRIDFRPLNTVHEIMNEIGYEPGYAYDDLVFSNDAIFIIQFSPKAETELLIFINEDCISEEKNRIEMEFGKKANLRGYSLLNMGTFKLSANEKTEEIDIHFQIPEISA